MQEDPHDGGEGIPFGQYVLWERIGRGGMAEIWRATFRGARGFERPLVVKKILPAYARRRSFVEMFIREAKLSSGLVHKNIVQIYELGEVEGEYFIAMEHVRGWDLLRVLHRCTKSGIPFPSGLAPYVVSRIAEALAYAHGASAPDGRPLGIVHLDVSPSNVLLGIDGTVKLTDFGVARAAIERASGDESVTLRGKLAYMSPEQVAGKEVDARSDLFSLGIVLYELLTQKRLFRARTALETLANIRTADVEPRLQIHPEIPDALRDVVRKALTRRRASRYQTAAAFAADLDDYLFGTGQRVTEKDVAAFLQTLFAGSEPGPQQPAGDQSVSGWESSVRARSAQTFDRSRSTGGGRRFVFRKTDGSGFGPMPLAAVLELVRRRAVTPDELVSVDGGDWRPLEDIDALREALATEPPQPEAAPVDDGLFDITSAVRVCSRLAWQRATGRLTLERFRVRKDVYLVRGTVVHVCSNRKDELLGPFLLRRGEVKPVQLQVAVSQARRNDDQLGTALVQLGFLDHARVFRLLLEQLEERFAEIFRWQSGRYAFFAGERPPKDVVTLQLEALPAIASAVRRGVPEPLLLAYFERLGDPRLHMEKVQPFELGRLQLNAREQRFADALHGPARSGGQLLQELAATDDDRATLLRVLFLLHQTGHLRTAGVLSGW